MVGETPDVIIRGNEIIKKPVKGQKKIAVVKDRGTVKNTKPKEPAKRVTVAKKEEPQKRRSSSKSPLKRFERFYELTKIATKNVKEAAVYCPTIESDLSSGYEPYIRVFVLKNGKRVRNKNGTWKTTTERLYMINEKNKTEYFSFPTLNVKNGELKKEKYRRPNRSNSRMVFQKVGNYYVNIVSDNFRDYKNFFDEMKELAESGLVTSKPKAAFLRKLVEADLPSVYKELYGLEPEKTKLEKRSAREIKNKPYMPKKAF